MIKDEIKSNKRAVNAALVYSGLKEQPNEDDNVNSVQNKMFDSFLKGVEYGTKLGIESIWHKTDEEPLKAEYIVAFTSSLLFIDFLCAYGTIYKDWNDFVSKHRIAGWTYKENLLPSEYYR